MNVKKFIAITTLCAATLCSGTFLTAAAETNDGITIPDSFTIEFTLNNVDDYTVGNNKYAFADGNYIYIYSVNAAASSGYDYKSGDMTVYEHSSAVLKVEFSEGNLYFSDGTTYLYSDEDGQAVAAEFEFTEYGDSYDATDGVYIYYVNSGELAIHNKTNYTTIPYRAATYSQLKEIDGVCYILAGTSLCTISDGQLTNISFSYENYTNVGNIATNGTAQALSEGSQLQTATVSAGAYIIRVDEDDLGEDTFTVWDDGVIFIDEDLTAQVLYMPDDGNAALIAVGSKTYLTLKTNLTIAAYTAEAVTSQSYYLLDSASVYSIPFENECTKTSEVAKDTVVTATEYVSGDEFDNAYYKVQYTESGTTVNGYVVASLLTSYSFTNDVYQGEVVEGGDQSDDNNILTIVLIMIIVLLVLIAVGYVIFIGTSNKRRRSR